MSYEDFRKAWAEVETTTYSYQGDWLMFADGAIIGSPENEIWFEEMDELYGDAN